MSTNGKGNNNKPKTGEVKMTQLEKSGMPLRITIASNKAPAIGSKPVKGRGTK